MKKHLSTIIALGVALVFLLLGCATWQNLTSNPDLTPKPEEFLKWEVVKVFPGEPGIFWLLYKNPNPESKIIIIAAARNTTGKLHEYRYFEGVNVYVFRLDDTGKFVGGLLTGDKRSRCVSCHQYLGQEAS